MSEDGSTETNIAPWKNTRLIFNVGGQHHEVFVSTLKAIPNTRLSWIAENYHALKESNVFDPVKKEFYFDRNSSCFAAIINYFQTGHLHYPANICGPMFENELNFWGIDETQMNSCCWTGYIACRDKNAKIKGLYSVNKRVERLAVRVNNYQKTRGRIWLFLTDPCFSKYAMIHSYINTTFLLLYAVAPIVHSMKFFRIEHSLGQKFVINIEIFLTAYFTLELLLKAYTCPSQRKFIKEKMTYVDLLSLIPVYIENLTVNNDILVYTEMLVIFRSIQLFRTFRDSYTMRVLSNTLLASSRELLLMTFLMFLLAIMFAYASYYVENKVEGTKFSSIPHCLWWSFITMTTVGYGDMYPLTWAGQIIGIMCAVCGLLMVALPVSVVATNFSTYYNFAKAQRTLPPKIKFKLAVEANTFLCEKDITRKRKSTKAIIRKAIIEMKKRGIIRRNFADIVLSSKGDWKNF